MAFKITVTKADQRETQNSVDTEMTENSDGFLDILLNRINSPQNLEEQVNSILNDGQAFDKVSKIIQAAIGVMQQEISREEIPRNLSDINFNGRRVFNFKNQMTIAFVPSDSEIFSATDLHGKPGPLINLIKQIRLFEETFITQNKQLVLLGDYIDRAPFYQFKTILMLLLIKLKFPNHLTLLRGNHEQGWVENQPVDESFLNSLETYCYSFAIKNKELVRRPATQGRPKVSISFFHTAQRLAHKYFLSLSELFKKLFSTLPIMALSKTNSFSESEEKIFFTLFIHGAPFVKGEINTLADLLNEIVSNGLNSVLWSEGAIDLSSPFLPNDQRGFFHDQINSAYKIQNSYLLGQLRKIVKLIVSGHQHEYSYFEDEEGRIWVVLETASKGVSNHALLCIKNGEITFLPLITEDRHVIRNDSDEVPKPDSSDEAKPAPPATPPTPLESSSYNTSSDNPIVRSHSQYFYQISQPQPKRSSNPQLLPPLPKNGCASESPESTPPRPDRPNILEQGAFTPIKITARI
ncbi:MAG: metallophosphoesterase [Gammaproteobacteria bacterium]|nr:metallophosphoesterase [Gammaproteobacteria bacterium]